jgi:uncharacterized membrane protein (UPF0127 family)
LDIVRILNRTRSVELAARARVANQFHTRLRGLLYSPQIQKGEGLLIKPCNSIHMFGMKYGIDAIFIDRDKILGLVHNIQPMQVSKVFPTGCDCLELPAGTISDTGTEVGDLVAIEPCA